MKFIRKLQTYAKHIPGWSTKRKLVVIESDDWGSTRMPNKEIYDDLLFHGIRVDLNKFTKYDTLANNDDLEKLFEVLNSVKDKNDNPAIFCPFTNVTNADFTKIIKSDFEQYFFETFDETLQKYYGDDVFKKWLSGLSEGYFVPQYHGREHFNVPLLMRVLSNKKNKEFYYAFKKGVIHIPLDIFVTNKVNSLAPTYYYDSLKDLEYLKKSLLEGVNIFNKLFNISSYSFNPPNGIFSLDLEESFKNTKVNNIVVNRSREEPIDNGKIATRNFLFKFGKYNSTGQIYYRRNVKFEPIQKSYSLDKTLFEIKAAFDTGKPAIISTHRINFVGSLDDSIRDRGLLELGKLLRILIEKYPDVEFINSIKLGQIMRNSNNK
ncbi:MAG: hypothetical protein WD059_04805 [Balneolaceae bacterium]